MAPPGVQRRLAELSPEARAVVEKTMREYELDESDPAVVLALLLGDFEDVGDRLPNRIRDAADDAVRRAEEAAREQAQAASAEVQKALIAEVSAAVTHAARKSRLRWAGIVTVVAMLSVVTVGGAGYLAGWAWGSADMKAAAHEAAELLQTRAGEVAVGLAKANPELGAQYERACAAPDGSARTVTDAGVRCALPVWTLDGAPSAAADAPPGTPPGRGPIEALLSWLGTYSPLGIALVGGGLALVARKLAYEATHAPWLRWLLR